MRRSRTTIDVEDCKIRREKFECDRRHFKTRKGRRGRREDRNSVTKKKGCTTTKIMGGVSRAKVGREAKKSEARGCDISKERRRRISFKPGF